MDDKKPPLMTYEQFQEIEKKKRYDKYKEKYDSLSQEEKKKLQKDKFCEICQVMVKNNNFSAHIATKAHIEKAKEKGIIVEKPYKYCETCKKNIVRRQFSQHCKTKKHNDILNGVLNAVTHKREGNWYNRLSEEEKELVKKKKYLCSCCNIEVLYTNKFNHEKSKKHILNQEKQKTK